MQKKLTITVSKEVYDGLYAKVGPRAISRFIDNLARPHVVDQERDEAYKGMAEDEQRELSADEWTENLISDIADETR